MPIDMTHPYGQLLSRMSRRQLLDIAWKLGAVAALPMTTRVAWAQPIFRTYPFSLGVASGDPWPTSVVLWTRLAPEPFEGGGMPTANVEVSWQVATDRTFRTSSVRVPQWRGRSLATACMSKPRGSRRAANISIDSAAAAKPVRLAAPRPRRRPARQSIGCALACAAAGITRPATSPATAGWPTKQFDFVFHTGDYIYEGRGDANRNPANVRQHLGQEIYTLVDYRNRYAQYKSDPDLMAAHLSAPFVMAWDDHEVDNDYAGDRDEHDTPPEVFLLRRAAAYQAYYESMPVRASMIPAGATCCSIVGCSSAT